MTGRRHRVSRCRPAYFASLSLFLTLAVRRRSREAAILFSESWWRLTMRGCRPSLSMIIPNTKRQPNTTKADQLYISEVITALPRPYHNMSVELYVWYNKKALFGCVLVYKVRAKNTYVQNPRYITVQHHILSYYPGKASGYLRPYILTESNSVSRKKRIFSATGLSKVKAKNTHVLNSTYIKIQHYPMIFTM